MCRGTLKARVLDCCRSHHESHTKTCFVLVIILAAYIIFGALLFVEIEKGFEKQSIAKVFEHRAALFDWIYDNFVSENRTVNYIDREEFLALVVDEHSEYVDYAFHHLQPGALAHGHKPMWNFGGALLFCTSVITTIGFGFTVPKTEIGRLIMYLYAAIGIPLFFLILQKVGTLLNSAFQHLERACRKLNPIYFGRLLKTRVAPDHDVHVEPPSHMERIPVSILDNWDSLPPGAFLPDGRPRARSVDVRFPVLPPITRSRHESPHRTHSPHVVHFAVPYDNSDSLVDTHFDLPLFKSTTKLTAVQQHAQLESQSSEQDMPVEPATSQMPVEPTTPHTQLEPTTYHMPEALTIPEMPVETRIPQKPMEPTTLYMPVEANTSQMSKEPTIAHMPVEPTMPYMPLMPVEPITPDISVEPTILQMPHKPTTPTPDIPVETTALHMPVAPTTSYTPVETTTFHSQSMTGAPLVQNDIEQVIPAGTTYNETNGVQEINADTRIEEMVATTGENSNEDSFVINIEADVHQSFNNNEDNLGETKSHNNNNPPVVVHGATPEPGPSSISHDHAGHTEDYHHYMSDYGSESGYPSHRSKESSIIQDYSKLSVPLVMVVLLVYMAAGSLLLMWREEWHLSDAVYFIFSALTTIGFSDVEPLLLDDPTFFVPVTLFILFGLTLQTMLINALQFTFHRTYQQAVLKAAKASKKLKRSIHNVRSHISHMIHHSDSDSDRKHTGGTYPLGERVGAAMP